MVEKINMSLARTILIMMMIAAGAAQAETTAGPVPARVVRVVDGDTIAVHAYPWLRETRAVSVRLAGVDAPELKGRCPGEVAAARASRAFLAALAPEGTAIELSGIRDDAYPGRVVARVTVNGVDLSEAIVAAGHARRYDGKTKRQGWC